MKTLSSSLEQHYAQQTTSLATCWKVTRRDGRVFGFTQHDQDIDLIELDYPGTGGLDPAEDAPIVYDGVLYKARAGYTRSDIASNTNLDVDNNDIEGIFDSESITEADLRAGLWDGAEVVIFEVNFENLGMGRSRIRIGRLGQVTQGRQRFTAELLGLTWRYSSTTITEVTQPGCRATFGDQRCGLDLDGSPSITVGVGSPTIIVPILYTGTVDSFDFDRNAINCAARTQEDGFFNFGKLTFLGGLNVGLVFEVRYYVVGQIALQVIPPYTVYPGDSYQVRRGCDKKFETCKGYGNQNNFRGEPHLQGDDLLVQVGRRQ